MKISTKNFILTAVACLLLTAIGTIYGIKTSAQTSRQSANGSGGVLIPTATGEQVRRQFAFSVRTDANGNVKGHAVVHNALFRTEEGKKFQGNFDITCLNVVGNTATFGGTVKRTNDPGLEGATVFFVVQDNGEPGKGTDKISFALFSGVNDPSQCAQVTLADVEANGGFLTIDSGNIQVRNQ